MRRKAGKQSSARPKLPRPLSRSPLLEDITVVEGWNYREVSEEYVQALARSIEEEGLINPISVELRDGKLYLIAGHSRYRAHKLINAKRIRASVYENLSERQREVILFWENSFRVDANPVEEAGFILKLFPSLRTSRMQLAEACAELGKTKLWMQDRLAIAAFPLDIQDMFASKRLGTSAIRALERAFHDGEEFGRELALKMLDAVARGQRMTEVEDHRGKTVNRGRKRPTQKKIMEKILMQLDATIIGMGPRMGAYCAGMISDQEIDEDIRKYADILKTIKAESQV